MKKKYIVISLLSILVMTIGMSYAYFTGMVIGEGKPINVKSNRLAIIFTDKTEISDTEIEPGWNTSKTFTVENKSGNVFYYDINIEELVNTFVTNGYLQYKITSTDGGYNMDEFIDIPKSDEERREKLAHKIQIDNEIKHTYKIEFKYPNDEDVNQSDDMGKEFGGRLSIAESDIIIIKYKVNDIIQDTLPDRTEPYIVKGVECTNNAEGIWNEEREIVEFMNSVSQTTCIVEFKEGYTVSIVAENEEVVNPKSKVVGRIGETTFTVEEKEGYSLENSSVVCDNGAEGSVLGNIITISNINKDNECKIITNGVKVIVVYDQNGGSGVSPLSNVLTFREKYILPLVAPTRAGYTFGGWYTEVDGGTEITENTNVINASNHSIYAHWNPNTITVTLDDQSATSAGTKVVYYKYNTAYYSNSDLSTPITKITVPVKTGYIFGGYYASIGGEGTKYINADGTFVNNSNSNLTANTTLYAYWTKNTYTVTYNQNGGSGVSPASNTVTYGGKYKLPSTNPTKVGYTFAGWFTAASGGTEVTTNTSVTATSNHSIYAHWTPNKYTVSYNANGGSGSMTSDTVTYDTNYTVKANTFTRSGYKFKGWNESSNGTGIDWTSWIGSPIKWTSTKSITLYAQWEKDNRETFTINSSSCPDKINDNSGACYIIVNNSKTVTYNGKTYTNCTINSTSGGRGSDCSKVQNSPSYAEWGGTSIGWNVTSDIIPSSEPCEPGNICGGGFTQSWRCIRNSDCYVSCSVNLTCDLSKNAVTPTVIYNVNGGSGVNPTSNTVIYGENYRLPITNPTKIGYTFAGWFTAASGGTQITSSTKVTNGNNHTIYAHYNASTIRLMLDSQGALDKGTSAVYYKYNTATYYSNSALTTTITNITVPSKNGYTFGGYYTGVNGSGTQYINASGGFVNNPYSSLTSYTTLYAKWTPKTYTITYDANGGSGVSPTSNGVTYETKYKLPTTDPTRAGYTFAGWFTAASGGTQVTTNTTLTNASNHSIYAHWTVNAYTITYNQNGGSGVSPVNNTVTYGSWYKLPTTNPSKTGHSFVGWFTAASGGTQITSGTTLTNASNHSIYAHYIANDYTITYNQNGGNGASPLRLVVTYGDKYRLPVTNPTKEGYTFAGWYTATTSGTEITINTDMQNASHHEIYAHWTANSYTVTYDTNGGSGVNPASNTVTYGTKYKLPVTNPTRAGYTFAGWFTSRDGGTKVTTNTTMSNASNHSIYAHWTPNTVTLTLNNQSATNAGTNKVYYAYNLAKFYSNSNLSTEITKITVPSRTGYKFEGYYSEVNGGGVQYINASGTFINNLHTLLNDTILYAKWKKNPNPVTFTMNSSSCPDKVNDNSGACYVLKNNSETVRYNGKTYVNCVINSKTVNYGSSCRDGVANERCFFSWKDGRWSTSGICPNGPTGGGLEVWTCEGSLYETCNSSCSVSLTCYPSE